MVLSNNSPVDGDTSIEAPSMEVWGKRRRKKMKDRKEKRKEAEGYFCPNSIFGAIKTGVIKVVVVTQIHFENLLYTPISSYY